MTRRSALVAAVLLAWACDNAFEATSPVVLVPGDVSSWTDTLELLDTLTVQLPLEDENGEKVSGPEITYTSNAPEVVLVVPTESGARLVALAVGTAVITASVEDARYDVNDFAHTVSVVPIQVSWPDTLNVTNTDTVRVHLGPRYAGGRLGWRSTNESVFRVLPVDTSVTSLDSVVVIEAVGTGQANVVVSAGGGIVPVGEMSLPVWVHQKWLSVSAAMTHTCALTVNHVPYCWGANDNGQLGDGSFSPRTRPTPVATPLKFDELQAGGVASGTYPPESHSCGRLGPQVLCWGSAQSGELQYGSGYCYDAYNPQTCYQPLPVTTTTATAVGGQLLTVGGRITCVLRSTEPDPLCWGMAPGDIGDTPWISFMGKAGGQHVCFVGVTGSAPLGTVCSGLNDAGQLGDGTTTNRLANDYGGLVRPGAADLYALSVGGGKHTCVLNTGVGPRALWCWGSNSAGQLGPNGPGAGSNPCPAGACSRVPVAVPVPVDIAAGSLTLGGKHTCFLSTVGDAYCWGDDSAGQLGDGTPGGSRSTPQPAAAGIRFSALSAGDIHTCGVSLSGTLYCWGAGGNGALLGTASGTNGSIPLRVQEPLAN